MCFCLLIELFLRQAALDGIDGIYVAVRILDMHVPLALHPG